MKRIIAAIGLGLALVAARDVAPAQAQQAPVVLTNTSGDCGTYGSPGNWTIVGGDLNPGMGTTLITPPSVSNSPPPPAAPAPAPAPDAVAPVSDEPVDTAAAEPAPEVPVDEALASDTAASPETAAPAPTAGPATIDSGGEVVLLRESPGYDAAVLATLDDGSALDVAGAPDTAADGSSWLPVAVGDQSGYVPTGYVVAAPAMDNTGALYAAAAGDDADLRVTLAPLTLRAGPSEEADPLLVVPEDALVTLTYEGLADGYITVAYDGESGWVSADLLGEVPVA
jgi:uncharacterized protein YraI